MIEIHAAEYAIIGIVVLLILVVLIFKFCIFINKFKAKLRYFNCEIYRNAGEEQKFWIRQRRRLWLSLIPFVKFR